MEELWQREQEQERLVKEAAERERLAKEAVERERFAALQHLGEGAGVLPQVMEQMKLQLEAQLQTLDREAVALTREQVSVRQKRQMVMAHLRRAVGQVAEAEAAQLVAQECEEYEAAEQCVGRAAKLAVEVEQLDRAGTQLKRELERLADQRLKFQEMQATLWMRSAEQMEREVSKRKGIFVNETVAFETQERRAHDSLREQLEDAAHQLQHLRFDLEKVDQERNLIEEAVAARTSVERAEVEGLKAEREKVRAEIETARLLLQQKESEDRVLSKQLAEASARVVQVRETFAPKLSKLEERHKHIAAREADLSSRQAAVIAQQEQLRQHM